MKENENIVIIGASEKHREQKAILFTWNGLADSWILKKELPAKGTTGIHVFESGVLAVTNGILNYWDTANLLPQKRIPGGGESMPGAHTEYNNIPHFGVNGKGIYGYGRRDDQSPYALNLEFPLEGDVGSLSTHNGCLLYTSPSPRDRTRSRMPSSA